MFLYFIYTPNRNFKQNFITYHNPLKYTALAGYCNYSLVEFYYNFSDRFA